ncbi:uncharacterized protein B0I36DRAFT_349293 [Microdochium trichocladiopsis]|uniref:Uncharacterized protein n=1 Tax=Microdochium trichocladiopsis TaxID=1682393 RepID=A0A9P8Y6R4_9PEZI|nr:uncharacterized protein B0I36DRAFT_349293 [Microdochium trichocladiopsis]KAH7031180.1 hypothetical protein B0I36DRAFT_349293 [Microdochium trichocladiopsis]
MSHADEHVLRQAPTEVAQIVARYKHGDMFLDRDKWTRNSDFISSGALLLIERSAGSPDRVSRRQHAATRYLRDPAGRPVLLHAGPRWLGAPQPVTRMQPEAVVIGHPVDAISPTARPSNTCQHVLQTTPASLTTACDAGFSSYLVGHTAAPRA